MRQVSRLYIKQPWNNLYNLKAWKLLRLEVFIRDQYICKICGKVAHTNHKHPHAAIADHIVPHKGDKALFFDIDNIQTVGKSCHDSIKQSMEKGSVFHPVWLEPSAIPLEIVCGAPCSGKTTYVNKHKKPCDVVIDLDDIRHQVTGVRHGETLDDLNLIIRKRNKLLSSLSRMNTGKAFFIVGAPTQAERLWWQSKLGGNIVLIEETISTCIARASKSGDWRVNAVKKWFNPKQFKAPKPKQSIGEDGWPL